MIETKDQHKKKLLFLTLDGFSNTGGIQSVCKNMAFTLNSICGKSNSMKVLNLSLYDNLANDEYIKVENFHGCRGNTFNFCFVALRQGITSDTIIVSHINLLLFAVFIKLLNRKSRIIMLAHGTEIWRGIPVWKSYFIRFAVHIWSVSKHTKDILIKKHNIDKQDITVLNNCLDPFHYTLKDLGKPEELLILHTLSTFQPILISVCRMSYYDRDKGYEITLDAISRLYKEFPDIHYFMIGCIEASELIRINTLIDALAIKQYVTVLGYVSDFELAKYYLLADLFVLPSTKEGFGIVFIEAASFGCTIISGNEDGSNEALLNGTLGISINPSSESLTSQIAISLKNKPSTKSKRNLQRQCLKQFSQCKYEERVKTLLR
jgi:phosphatidylinositol alpha-1,6-mannosyltransferase